MLQLAVLISGRGSNMVRLAEAIKAEALNVKITIVISNQDCDGITHAKNLGIATKIIKRQDFDSRQSHDAAIKDAIHTSGADYVFLAGYMAILGPAFTAAFAGKLLNIHPSLLPAFKGLDTHQRAIDAKVATHGASVHLVTAELDDGPIILQAKLAVLPDDAADSLAARVLQLEHQLYPFVLKCLADGHLSLSENGVQWHQSERALNQATPQTRRTLEGALVWPVTDGR